MRKGRRKRIYPAIIALSLAFAVLLFYIGCGEELIEELMPRDTYPTSLHATAQGMRTFYTTADGFEHVSHVPYDTIGCKDCHAEGGPARDTCDACHAENKPAEESTCLPCHSRQKKEIDTTEDKGVEFSDIHRDAGMTCMDCHSLRELHGDGTPYESMWEAGAMDTNCQKCHEGMPAETHSIHNDKLDCSACHVKEVVTCYNCHFQSLVDKGEKIPYKALHDWSFLLNNDEGKVRTGNFQSVYYDDKTFIVFAPFHSHSTYTPTTITISKPTVDIVQCCDDCHNNKAIQELDAKDAITVTSWSGGALQQMTGVIPVVDGKLEFQYLDYLAGPDTWIPTISTKAPDGQQYGYSYPLTTKQVGKLKKHAFGKSLHTTAKGMETFYTAAHGSHDGAFTGSGFGFISGVSYNSDELTKGCADCHAGGGPDRESCYACHAEGKQSEDATCLGCHSRQSKEKELGFTDVHDGFEKADECMDCHSLKELHGDGPTTAYISMWEAGAMDTSCQKCHAPETISTGTHHTVHGDKLDCSACHVKEVVTCYNCHFESLLGDPPVKEPYKPPLRDWTFLLNSNGKVRTGNFQSVYYNGEPFIVFAPFHSHSVTLEGRQCGECHNNEAIQKLGAEGAITVTSWSGGALQHMTGVIPVVDGKLKFQYLDFDGSVWTDVGPGPMTTVNTQFGYSSPLTQDQINALNTPKP
jgi:hypothetical protein